MHYFSTEQIAFINIDKKAAPKYKTIKGRSDPFDLDAIHNSIKNQIYSEYLKKHITNIQEACWHAEYQCSKWREEDLAEAEATRKQNNRIRQQRFQQKKKENQNPLLIAAKEQLDNAIDQRTAILKQWNAYVNHLRLEYLRIKTTLEQGAQNDQSK